MKPLPQLLKVQPSLIHTFIISSLPPHPRRASQLSSTFTSICAWALTCLLSIISYSSKYKSCAPVKLASCFPLKEARYKWLVRRQLLATVYTLLMLILQLASISFISTWQKSPHPTSLNTRAAFSMIFPMEGGLFDIWTPTAHNKLSTKNCWISDISFSLHSSIYPSIWSDIYWTSTICQAHAVGKIWLWSLLWYCSSLPSWGRIYSYHPGTLLVVITNNSIMS